MAAIDKSRVLHLYRDIFRLSRVWQSQVSSETQSERCYIQEEARRLFRKNKEITNEQDIQQCIKEAEARIELAKHYRIPYPRPVNAAPNSVPSSKDKKAQMRRRKEAEPIYTRSLDQ